MRCRDFCALSPCLARFASGGSSSRVLQGGKQHVVTIGHLEPRSAPSSASPPSGACVRRRKQQASRGRSARESSRVAMAALAPASGWQRAGGAALPRSSRARPGASSRSRRCALAVRAELYRIVSAAVVKRVGPCDMGRQPAARSCAALSAPTLALANSHETQRPRSAGLGGASVALLPRPQAPHDARLGPWVRRETRGWPHPSPSQTASPPPRASSTSWVAPSPAPHRT